MSKKKKSHKKKNRKHWIILFLLVCVLIVLNSNKIKREIIKTYNQLSVYFERIQEGKLVYAQNFGIHIPKGYTVHGIDVSRYQKKINWEKLANVREGDLRISFVFVKASEGKTLSDRYFSYNMDGARKQRILCGAYHYYKPNVNSKEQAMNFISLVDLKPGDLPPVLDIEEESPYGDKNMKQGIKNWLEIVEQHYKMKPIIYTSNNFHSTYLSGKEFREYPFWIAHYYKGQLKTSSNWIFWQHSDKAKVNGINALVDMNVYNGNIEKLKKLCKKM